MGEFAIAACLGAARRNGWIDDPAIMREIENLIGDNKKFEQEEWKVANSRFIRTGGGYTYPEFHAVISRITDRKTKLLVRDDHILHTRI